MKIKDKIINKVFIYGKGDYSIGMDGYKITVSFNDGFYLSDKEDMENIRKILKQSFGEIVDRNIEVLFDFEQMEKERTEYEIKKGGKK